MTVSEAFYEAAIRPDQWGRTLNAASSAWGADGVVVSSYPDCMGGLIHSDGLESFCARFIEEGWNARDIRSARGIPLVRKGREIVTDADLFTADELQRLPFYTDFLPSSGLGWFAGTVLADAGGVKITLSLHRRAGRNPFSKTDLAQFRRDLPHVQRAARLASRIRLSYAEGLVDSLERFTCGAILIDWLGRVIHLNARAEGYLGEHLQIVSSHLRSPNREANKSLQELIAACTQPVFSRDDSGPSWALLPRPDSLPILVQSYPIARQALDLFQGARGLLLVSDPSENRPLAAKLLQEMFHLTPAELRVSAGLVQGLDTQQIAEAHQISAQTVRYHLKSIFAKTGTSHQAQLVSLLVRFPGNL